MLDSLQFVGYAPDERDDPSSRSPPRHAWPPVSSKEACLQTLLHTSLYPPGDARSDSASSDGQPAVIHSPFADGMSLVAGMRARSTSPRHAPHRGRGHQRRASRDLSVSPCTSLHDLPLLREIPPFRGQKPVTPSGSEHHVFATDRRVRRHNCVASGYALAPAKDLGLGEAGSAALWDRLHRRSGSCGRGKARRGSSAAAVDRHGVRRAVPRDYVYHTPRKAEKRQRAEEAVLRQSDVMAGVPRDCRFQPQISARAAEREGRGKKWWVGLSKQPKRDSKTPKKEEHFPYKPNLDHLHPGVTLDKSVNPKEAAQRLYSDSSVRRARRENDRILVHAMEKQSFKKGHDRAMAHGA